MRAGLSILRGHKSKPSERMHDEFQTMLWAGGEPLQEHAFRVALPLVKCDAKGGEAAWVPRLGKWEASAGST